ncbi:NAD-dependent epimerase/dehydratase family protein [Plantactinospora mayteni]|uniref:Reductase n=1 Tax=Plantactinospora mayteni TaxID=566021 RepID=A0ABQ4EHD2_9ACTN|nr:NAD-dependent epimerase/dehydratase [Plantactinospora mayteni]GIG93646.1 reductase [Plantactinospora mayteni]
MSTVLLFGASGFVGRQVRAVLAPDAELCCPGRMECDLGAVEPGELTRLVRTVAPDAVVNCTGALDGTDEQLVLANTLVTAKLVEAVAVGAPRARLVRIGSAGEYGPMPVGAVVEESAAARPGSAHGVSHLAGTRLVELAAQAGRVDGVVLRVFNAVGPGLPTGNVLGRAAVLLRQALARDEDRIVLGSLDAYRDFVDVRDVALAVRAAVRTPALPRRVFNIGSGRAVPTRTAVELLARAAGFTGRIVEEPGPPGTSRSGGASWACADTRAAAGLLGWRPGYDLPASVSALWYATAGIELPDRGMGPSVTPPAQPKESAGIHESAL